MELHEWRAFHESGHASPQAQDLPQPYAENAKGSFLTGIHEANKGSQTTSAYALTTQVVYSLTTRFLVSCLYELECSLTPAPLKTSDQQNENQVVSCFNVGF
jgi:hypothetical protein